MLFIFRTSIQCHVLYNGDTSAAAKWTGKCQVLSSTTKEWHFPALPFVLALNTTAANIILFSYDPNEQIQSLYSYGQDRTSILRSDDRGQTWVVTDQVEYSDVSRVALVESLLQSPLLVLFQITSKCAANTRVCTASDSYSLLSGAPGWLQLQSGNTLWSASIRGVWTQQSSGTLAFDWFGY